MKDLLYLKDDQIKDFIQLLFYAYRETFLDPKDILAKKNFGLAHLRAINLVEKYPGISLSELMFKLKITKQSLNRVMREVIKEKDTTYSPLALYFLIDNELLEDRNDVNSLFDILINKTSLENEIKNLIIYKKALFNADAVDENELLDLTKPILNSNSVWESHTLYLVAEYFYSKNEKQKAKEFFNKILSLDNVNLDIKKEAQKRLNRDLSE